MKLTSEDYAALERCWITPQIADRAGVFRVANIDGQQLIGRRAGADLSGIVFPYYRPGDRAVVLHRLRVDRAPIDSATGKAQYRYLTPLGSRNRLYLPACDPELLRDASVPIVFSEGEKKCLALWHAALTPLNGTGGPPFLPMSVPGAWAWRSVIGNRATAAAPGHDIVKGPIPDLDLIEWHNRRVTILFDTNVASNDSVRAARRALASELAARGAEVWLADLPPAPGINGCDDYLAVFGAGALLEVLKQSARYEWREDLIMSDKGKILPKLTNAITVLRNAPEWRGVLAYDEFSLFLMAVKPTPWAYTGKWTDHQDCLLTDWLQRHGVMVEDGVAAKAAQAAGQQSGYHPVRKYLESLVWDKVGRLDNWVTLYLGSEPSELVRIVGAKWLISAAARVYQPGCKADHMLIAEGPQGILKSSAFRALATPWFTDDIADLGSKDSALATLGAWIIELPELDAMSRAELTRVKAFMSRQTDRFRPPYGRHIIESPRQCVFVGTVNHSEYLRDETGGRRFWPVSCGRIDLESLKRDRDQLWAEAVARYRNNEPWWLDTPELNREAEQVQDDRYQADSWEPVISHYLELQTECTTTDILEKALKKPTGQWTHGDSIRVGAIMRHLKWSAHRLWGNGTRQRVYRPD